MFAQVVENRTISRRQIGRARSSTFSNLNRSVWAIWMWKYMCAKDCDNTNMNANFFFSIRWIGVVKALSAYVKSSDKCCHLAENGVEVDSLKRWFYSLNRIKSNLSVFHCQMHWAVCVSISATKSPLETHFQSFSFVSERNRENKTFSNRNGCEGILLLLKQAMNFTLIVVWI